MLESCNYWRQSCRSIHAPSYAHLQGNAIECYHRFSTNEMSVQVPTKAEKHEIARYPVEYGIKNQHVPPGEWCHCGSGRGSTREGREIRIHRIKAANQDDSFLLLSRFSEQREDIPCAEELHSETLALNPNLEPHNPTYTSNPLHR